MLPEEAHVSRVRGLHLEDLAGPVGECSVFGPYQGVWYSTGGLEEVVAKETIAIAVGTGFDLQTSISSTHNLYKNCTTFLEKTYNHMEAKWF